MGRVPASEPDATAWSRHEFLGPGDDTGPAADAAAGLVSLSFVTAAIRRRRRVWCIAAVIGLLAGASLFLVRPPAYQATASALLTLGPNEDLTTAIETDVALAESRPVAALARQQLKLPESVSSVLGSYTAVPVTNRVVLITAKAKSAPAAVRLAGALTTAFLQFRADQLRSYQNLISTSLNQEIATGNARVAALTRQVAAESGQPASLTQAAKLAALQAQLRQANGAQSALVQGARSAEQSTQVGTNTAVRGSYIVDAATLVAKSRKKTAVIYALSGLVGGLALGIGFIVLSAFLSDRLRVREDIARALGAPVRLSVGRVRLSRLQASRRGLVPAGHPAIHRITGHLRSALADDADGTSLAVIPAGQPDVAALTVVALALSYTREDKRAIVADLGPGSPAARLLGVTEAGVHAVQVAESRLFVVIPDRDDIAPTGPLTPATPGAGRPGEVAAPPAELADAYNSADILLTLAPLDPMLGSGHLVTWATAAAVVVTGGESTWTRVQAVGEMIRLAGLRLVSAVLVGADRGDESLGMTPSPRADRAAGSARRDRRAASEGLLVSLNGSSAGTPPDDQ
jgi:capsular polysaccharide biosynthesis protein